jgi:formylglycine-generating enzyme required for sulfatase activity
LQEGKVRFPQFIAVTWLALLCALAPAHAEKRVALVIGNERYANLSANEQLQKAVNDARAVGGALKRIGFDVISGENLGRQALLARLDEAAQRLTQGDMVFFFFSGHGITVDGFNYILPADVPAVRSGQIVSLTGAAIKEEDITAALLRAGARVAVVVLDACRNNPFTVSGTKGVGGERGLAPHEPPSGVFTLYAASRGEAALDQLYDGDQDPNSVFTRAVLPALVRPELDLPGLALEVRKEVTRLARSVNHAQRPAYYDETSGDRIFLAAARPSGLPPASTTPASSQQVAVVAPPVTPAMPAADPCRGPVTASVGSRCAAPLMAAQERGLKPKEIFRECDSCPEMVVVPAGSFTMGSPADEKDREPSEGPQHVVTIGRSFAMGKLHVTVEQFTAFVRETGYEASSTCGIFEDGEWREGTGHTWRNPGFAQEGLHPVVCVTLDDANAYVDWLAKKTGKFYRLPSEGEWEYAARGRTSPGAYPRFWFGDDPKDLCQYGNSADQKARDNVTGAARWTIAPCNDGHAYTSPAGHFVPNAFGLYDMFGNAWQLTADCPHDNYNGAPADGTAWTTGCRNYYGHLGVVRGGSWNYGPWSLRAASRQMYGGYAFIGVGFRVARTLI